MRFNPAEHAASAGNDIVKDPAAFATNLRLDGAPVIAPSLAEIRPPGGHMGFDPTEHAAGAGNNIVEDPTVFATNLRLNRAPVGVPFSRKAGSKRSNIGFHRVPGRRGTR